MTKRKQTFTASSLFKTINDFFTIYDIEEFGFDTTNQFIDCYFMKIMTQSNKTLNELEVFLKEKLQLSTYATLHFVDLLEEVSN